MNLYDTLLHIFDKYGYNVPKNTKGINKEILLSFIANKISTQRGALGYSAGGWNKFIKKCFPDKPKNTNYYDWLLLKENLKYCNSCDTVKHLHEFWKNKSKTTGVNDYCTPCRQPLNTKAHRSIQARYRAAKIKACPIWADKEKLKIFYDNCPAGYHVDHIVPLQGKHVCGLHIPINLQYLKAEDNINKRNYHESEEFWK